MRMLWSVITSAFAFVSRLKGGTLVPIAKLTTYTGCAKSGLTGEQTATGTADKVAQDTKIDPLSEKTPVT